MYQMSDLFADREALSEQGYSFLCANFAKNPFLRNLIEFNVDEQVVRLLKKGEDDWKEYSSQEVIEKVGRMQDKDLSNTAVSLLEHLLDEKHLFDGNEEQGMQINPM